MMPYNGTSMALQREPTDGRISLSEMISALSFALDLTEGAIHGHAVRTCVLGMRLATAAGVPADQMFDLYYALLLKDIGCSSNAARMTQIVGGGDDRAMKAGVKMVDWTQAQRPTRAMLQLLWKNVLPEANPVARIAHIVRLGAQDGNTEQMIEMRCEQGGKILRKLGFGEVASRAVRGLDEHWDGCGYPGRLKGEEIPLAARVLALAQHLDVFSTGECPEVAIGVMHTRSGKWFDPELVRVAADLHKAGRLWHDCLAEDDEDDTRRVAIDMEPGASVLLNGDQIDRICAAFADVIDAKSPYTFRHSIGVTKAAMKIAHSMNLPKERIHLVRRAALLHDIGKLSVSNSILDKSGKLTAEEWIAVKEHPVQTRRILERVTAFEEMAVVASEHHERLNGSGYPDRLTAKDLSVESRIIAVADVYGALSEERPYRAGLSLDEIVVEMGRDLPHRLDPDCFDALMHGLRPSAAPIPMPLLVEKPVALFA